MAGNVPEYLAGVGVQGVGHRHLAEQAQRKQLQGRHRAGRVKPVLLPQLRQQGAGAADGPGGDCAEKAQKRRQVQRAFLGGHIAPAHVHQIADGRKGVKAHAQREGQLVQHPRCKHRHKKVEVLEHRQQRQQAAHAHSHQPAPPGRLNGPAQRPAEQADGHKQPHGQQLPAKAPAGCRGAVAPVKPQAGRQQHAGLDLFGRLQIAHSRQRQEGNVRKVVKTQRKSSLWIISLGELCGPAAERQTYFVYYTIINGESKGGRPAFGGCRFPPRLLALPRRGRRCAAASARLLALPSHPPPKDPLPTHAIIAVIAKTTPRRPP